LVGRATTDTLTNKTLTGATISGATNTITNIGVASGGTGVATLTSGNFLVGAGTGAVTTAKVAPAGVVVGTTDSQTLTNKDMTDNTNNVAARGLWSNNGATLTSTYSSGAPTIGKVLTATAAATATWQSPAVQYVSGVAFANLAAIPANNTLQDTMSAIAPTDGTYYVSFSTGFIHSIGTTNATFAFTVNGVYQPTLTRIISSGTNGAQRFISLSGFVANIVAGNAIGILYSSGTSGSLTILQNRNIVILKVVL
jgi:hypothetical protein